MLKQLGLARNVQHSRMPKDKKCGKRPTFKLLIHLLLFFAQWPGSSGDVAAAAAAAAAGVGRGGGGGGGGLFCFASCHCMGCTETTLHGRQKHFATH